MSYEVYCLDKFNGPGDLGKGFRCGRYETYDEAPDQGVLS